MEESYRPIEELYKEIYVSLVKGQIAVKLGSAYTEMDIIICKDLTDVKQALLTEYVFRTYGLTVLDVAEKTVVILGVYYRDYVEWQESNKLKKLDGKY